MGLLLGYRSPQVRLSVLVAAGGFAGTLARFAVGVVLPSHERWPIATFAVNVTGAFILGLLSQWLNLQVTETRIMRWWRLGFGTGLLGSYTTFSTLAVGIERLIADGVWLIAVIYAVLSLALGLAAAVAGIVVADRWTAKGPGPPDTASDGVSR